MPKISVRCIIENLRCSHNHPRSFRGSPLWYLVSQIFGLGSTSSCELCVQYGFDPCEKLK
jgi:hypothetical protein